MQETEGLGEESRGGHPERRRKRRRQKNAQELRSSEGQHARRTHKQPNQRRDRTAQQGEATTRITLSKSDPQRGGSHRDTLKPNPTTGCARPLAATADRRKRQDDGFNVPGRGSPGDPGCHQAGDSGAPVPSDWIGIRHTEAPENTMMGVRKLLVKCLLKGETGRRRDRKELKRKGKPMR